MPSLVPARLIAAAPSEQLLEALARFTVLTAESILAVAAGLLGARLMRRQCLHWSWAAAATALAVLAHRAVGHPALPVALGGVSASWRLHRWQRIDREDGLGTEGVLRGGRSPLTLAAWLLARAGSGSAGRADGGRSGELLLGYDQRWRTVTVPFGTGAGGTHTLVVGATGSGKTVTQGRIAVAAIAAGMGAVVIDPKGDSGLRGQLMAAARADGRRFLEWTPEGPTAYNPLARGSDTEIADKALGSERFTEPHYLRQAQRYLGHEVRALRAAGEQVTLAGLVEYLDPPNLEQLLRALPDELARSSFAYLDSLGPRQRADLAGVRDRLAVLSESDAGVWLQPELRDTEAIDLLSCARERAVVLFTLRSDSRPLLSQMLAAAIVQDLQTVVAASQGRPVGLLALIDEFSAVAPEHVVRLFGRARSAGISLVLGTQELADLRRSGNDPLAEQVIGNLSLLIAHRQVVPASAELIAGVAGSRPGWKVSRHSGGATTRTRDRHPLLEASDVMRLGTGWAAVLALAHTQGPPVRITRILPADSNPTREEWS